MLSVLSLSLNQTQYSFPQLQIDPNSRYRALRAGRHPMRSIMGEIIAEKRLACQNIHSGARLIGERMGTVIEERGQPAIRRYKPATKAGFPLGFRISHQMLEVS